VRRGQWQRSARWPKTSGDSEERGWHHGDRTSVGGGELRVGARAALDRVDASDREEGSCVWIRRCRSGVFYSRQQGDGGCRPVRPIGARPGRHCS
jgi:hypothetical protein